MQNNLVWSFSQLKKFHLVGVIFIGCILLSGCAGVMHRVPIIEKQPADACMSASVLITNLDNGVDRSTYQLPSGRICSGIDDNENKQEQKSQTA